MKTGVTSIEGTIVLAQWHTISNCELLKKTTTTTVSAEGSSSDRVQSYDSVSFLSLSPFWFISSVSFLNCSFVSSLSLFLSSPQRLVYMFILLCILM